MELEEAKSKLQAVLKTSFEQYWDNFKKFIRGKTPKLEFDGYVKTLLGDAHSKHSPHTCTIFIAFVI